MRWAGRAAVFTGALLAFSARGVASSSASLASEDEALTSSCDPGHHCKPGKTLCDGHCVSTSKDPHNCGACGVVCGHDERCESGTCELDCSKCRKGNGRHCPEQCRRCEPMDTPCGDECVDTSTDTSNCGGCGLVCPEPSGGAATCAAGVCGTVCPNGETDCGGVCVDGTCSGVCPDGTIDCSDVCVDPATDPANCGACGNACSQLEVCHAGACTPWKRVFLTSVTYTGNLGGLDGADAKCQAVAIAGGLSGTFRAWLSDSTGSPSTRFTHSVVPYKEFSISDGGTYLLVANDWADLTSGTIRNPIDRTESGIGFQVTVVWTATSTAGTLVSTQNDCRDWTVSVNAIGSTPVRGDVGRTNETDADWTQFSVPAGCANDFALYCFEQ